MNSFIQVNSVVIHDAQQQQWLFFQHPVSILVADTLQDVSSLLESVQHSVTHQGLYAVGFVSYEASPAFDLALKVKSGCQLPLAWFALYAQPETISLPVGEAIAPLVWTPDISRETYQQSFQQIKHAIYQGLTYQVNYSFRLRSPFSQNPWHYFLALTQAQNGRYGAFINTADWSICCASPELFFHQTESQILCMPMKGTSPRGLSSTQDQQWAKALQQSEKNRAENLMIVDMVRNDLGRIARTGTVTVPKLFELEQYPTLWQMTSTVQCQTDASLSQIFQALFPCASITGAPKPSTMKLITELERSPRQIYTGTIGFLTPHGTSQFNVAIRTVLIDKQQQQAEYGVGGGIVWDSVEQDEYEECCTKAKILTRSQPSFSLLETLLWTPLEGYFLLDLHLDRLQQSAAYFAFPMERASVNDYLERLAQNLGDRHSPHKVRLLLAPNGDLSSQSDPIAAASAAPVLLNVGLAKSPIQSTNPWLYHKTTARQVYEQAALPGYDDVILWNERGEITESCTANLIVEWDGEWYTPPLHCGLLAGTYRAWLLQQGKVKERVIRVEDLPHCSRLFLVNSVRHQRQAQWGGQVG
ncbi:MAG: aminodeoxychorismate synthase component I [Oculatellaceae cyanobacterium Prado106]|nr:aminodeoxychorismate synthase component I [Oculatellaceae cyanobacterium Prado106]